MATKELNRRVRIGLDDKEAALGRDIALNVIREGMRAMVPNYPELSERLRGTKSYSIANLDNLLNQAIEKLTSNGCKVYRAKSAQDAVTYVTSIVGQGLVVKSKSNAAKEVDLVKALEAQGSKVVETDLGDRIVQLANSHASHSLAPAIHMTVEKVAEVFSKDLDQDLPADAEALVAAARVSLRNYLLSANVGLSGANAIAADTGSIVVMENEGNIRAVTSLPRAHIAIAGIEKIVPTLEEALNVVRSASVYGVGQDFGTYASVISGPSRTLDLNGDDFPGGLGPEEVHVVLLEQGRWEAIDQGFEESLYCINCGSCLNFCPIYREVGEQYGDKYLGGRGVITAAIQKGIKFAEDSGLSLCLNCRNCIDACPSRISTPDMINRLREKSLAQEGNSFLWNKAFKIMANEKKLDRTARLGQHLQSLTFTKQEKGQKARLPIGLSYRRVVPILASKTFRDSWPTIVTPQDASVLFKRREPDVNSNDQKVAFFTGCMINYAYTSIGDAVLAVLGRQGITVEIPQGQGCCGLPMYLSGDTENARAVAKANITSLLDCDADTIIVACATCGSHLSESMLKLFSKEDPWYEKAVDVASKVKDISLYLSEQNLELSDVPMRITYHEPCHLGRGQDVKEQPRQLLQNIPGIKYQEMKDADSCCGFGGTCSVKQYEISEKVRKRKLNSIIATGAEAVTAGCPGCLVHLTDGIEQEGLAVKAYHPVELVAMGYGWKGRK